MSESLSSLLPPLLQARDDVGALAALSLARHWLVAAHKLAIRSRTVGDAAQHRTAQRVWQQCVDGGAERHAAALRLLVACVSRDLRALHGERPLPAAAADAIRMAATRFASRARCARAPLTAAAAWRRAQWRRSRPQSCAG